ncbi:MAG: carboxy terminal-processing peptidase [Nitrospinota bacterium]
MEKKIKLLSVASVVLFSLLLSHGIGFGSKPTLEIGKETTSLQPLPVLARTNEAILKSLKYDHYKRVPIDNHLSSEFFNKYLSYLDPARSYFYKTDIEEFEKYRYKLDDALFRGDLNPAYQIYNRYQKRLTNRLKTLIASLEKGVGWMDFTKKENLPLNRENALWPKNEAEMKELWRKRLKASVLNLMLADKKPGKIADLLIKRYTNKLNRVKQTKSDDVFQTYINALAQTYDPHTQYYSPRDTENFNIHMSLSFEGIGAFLQVEEEYTKVMRLIPAGPAEKSKNLKPADRIVGVGQGDRGEIVDVVGWRIDDVVQLIRGPKGTVVQLQIIPADGNDEHQTKVVKITRNTVLLEEQSAKKSVIEIIEKKKKYKIGVIDIPTFYLDFQAYRARNPDYKSTSKDVRRLLRELKKEKVDGVVVDLRDNGGGSLKEANDLTGLFIPEGPTVQIRSSTSRIEVLEDKDGRVEYDGPLIVLVNRLSASASEIFAGAIQDYRRGLVAGVQTFGKGTVQSLISLRRGQLKTTSAKFYRVSGESTQHKGILPDIQFPSQYDIEKIGESSYPEALNWDKINAVRYKPFPDTLSGIIPQLIEAHKNREKKNPDFIFMNKRLKHITSIREKTSISLNEKTRKKEREEAENYRLKIENERRVAKKLDPLEKIADLKEKEGGEEKKNGHKEAVEPKDDPVIAETGRILVDLISLL